METKILSSSGIPYYMYENRHLHSFCICLYVKAGALYENKEENGITHFFEHIVIRNINSIENGTLYAKLDQLGLTLNGTTYKEFVQFSISGAVSHFKEAATLFLKLFDPLILSDQEVDTERKRVIAEIRECEKKHSVDRKLEKTVWKDTSLQRTITGKKKRLEAIGLPELTRFRESFFSSNNMFFYLTGNISEEDLRFFDEALGWYSFKETQKKRRNKAQVPEAFFHRDGTIHYVKGKKPEVCIAFDLPAKNYTDAQLNLFFNLLFLGDYCPFYQELSEKTGYIYSYDDQMERYLNLGVMKVGYEVTAAKLEKALKKTIEIFKKMKDDPYSMEYVRAIFIDNADLCLDDVNDFNWDRAYECHILNENYPDIAAKKKAYESITQDDIKKMANEIFRRENMTVIIKGTYSKKKKETLEKLISEL